MGCLAIIAAGDDIGSRMPRGGCDKNLALAGAATVSGGGESGEDVETGVFARLTDGRCCQGSWLEGYPQR